MRDIKIVKSIVAGALIASSLHVYAAPVDNAASVLKATHETTLSKPAVQNASEVKHSTKTGLVNELMKITYTRQGVKDLQIQAKELKQGDISKISHGFKAIDKMTKAQRKSFVEMFGYYANHLTPKLQKQFESNLAEQLSVKELNSLNRFYSTSLGKEISKNEYEVQKQMEQARAYLQSPEFVKAPPIRTKIISKIIGNLLLVPIGIIDGKLMFDVIAPRLDPAVKELPKKHIDEQIQSFALNLAMAEAYALRNLNDQQLNDYLNFSETRAFKQSNLIFFKIQEEAFKKMLAKYPA